MNKYNSNGYLDLTAYYALRNIEKKKKKEPQNENRLRKLPVREKVVKQRD